MTTDLDREGEERWRRTFDPFTDPVIRRGAEAAQRLNDAAILDRLDDQLEDPICEIPGCLALAGLAVLCKPEHNLVIGEFCRTHRELVVSQQLARCPSCNLIGPPQTLFRWRVIFERALA